MHVGMFIQGYHYTQRAKTISWFLENHPTDILFYGIGWNSLKETLSENAQPYFEKQYGGYIPDKIETISRAKFVLAFENKRFEDYVSTHIQPHQLSPHTDIDAVITFSQITPELIAYLRKFNPYGPGNQKPVFWTKNVFDFGTSKLVGKNFEHIKLELEDNSTSRVINAIAFNMAQYFEHIHAHKPIDICYTIEHNKQANRGDSVQLMIKDIRLSEQ